MIETLQQKLEEKAKLKLRKELRNKIQAILDYYVEEIYLDMEARQYSISELLDIIKTAIIQQKTDDACKKEIENFIRNVELCKEQLDSLNQQ